MAVKASRQPRRCCLRSAHEIHGGFGTMNGATSLVKTLLANGVNTCFANPGTSEMHFVAALDQTPGMHCVLGLQENIVTGMADGYWRISRNAACTLLHC